jgi:hypothetical protein
VTESHAIAFLARTPTRLEPGGLPNLGLAAMICLSWTGIVDLARRIDSAYEATGVIDDDAVLRLARAILWFQVRLLGDYARESGLVASIVARRNPSQDPFPAVDRPLQ